MSLKDFQICCVMYFVKAQMHKDYLKPNIILYFKDLSPVLESYFSYDHSRALG